jgi:hypothetical protein
MEVTVSKSVEQNINVHRGNGPQIYLPEKRPDPAKLVPIDGGKQEGRGGA